MVEGRQEMSLLRASFPLSNLRDKPVLDELASAMSSGYKYIILEAQIKSDITNYSYMDE